MTSSFFTPEASKSIIAHMNTDHRDACIAMVRAHSNLKTVSDAEIVALDDKGIDLVFTQEVTAEQSSPLNRATRIDFPKPLTRPEQIRGMLVSLTKHARHTLESKDRDSAKR